MVSDVRREDEVTVPRLPFEVPIDGVANAVRFYSLPKHLVMAAAKDIAHG
jgi:hypothetical protein